MTTASQYDVIIVGCGPVGVVAAHLLGHHGLSTLVIEREREPYDLPRAIHIDHEIMRIFQSVGLAERLLPQFSMPAGAMHFGADRAVIRQFQQIVETDRLGWASDYFFYQPELERTLREALTERASVRVELGYALAALEQDADGVTITARNDEGETIGAAAKYLLGCDGGRSTVRKSLSIGLEDLGFDEPWIVVDALVDGPVTMPNLIGAPMGVDMQEVMFIVGDPARPTSVIPGVGRHRRWEFMMLPTDRSEDFADKQAAAPLIAPWLAEGQHCEIMRCAVYRFHALLAERWQDGRIFLVGDAAHQTPPFFGQGLCHGIRDAANLAWKLKLVLDGVADPKLLDTYQPERLPQVRSVVEASMRVGRYICTLDREAAQRRDAEMRAVAERTAPGYVDLIPSLTAGLLSSRGTEPSPVGSRFIQPPVIDAKGLRMLLDDATGGGFVMLGDASNIPPEPMAGDLPVHQFEIVDDERQSAPDRLFDCTGELFQWFRNYDCSGVLLRPDHYVYGVFRSAAEGSALLHSLREELAPERGGGRVE